MLRDTFIDQLQLRLGRNNDPELQTDIISVMEYVQTQILEVDVITPWFLVSDEYTSLVTSIGNEEVALPADFIQLWEGSNLYRYNSALADPYLEMVRGDWRLVKDKYNTAGPPTHYDIAGANLVMRPVADAEYPLRLRYIQKQATLVGEYGVSNNIENGWLAWAADWFMGEVGVIVAGDIQQQTDSKLKTFAAQRDRGRNRILAKNVSMQEVLKRRIRGGG